MKKIVFALMLAMIATLSVNAHRYRPAHVTISIQTFYDELAPYGDWLYSPDYGYVWRPYFDRPEAFRPYSSGGDWVYTDFGWTWVSDYRWGWAPFHYGRWYFDDYLGWMWIPGTEWAPAWVTWGSYNNYWGWAPLGPDVYVNVNFNWFAPDPWWTFVPCRHFYSSNWRNYIYDRPVRVTQITNITNIYINENDRTSNQWFRGPRVKDVERYGRTPVRRMEVVESGRPETRRVDNDRVSIYNPRIEKNSENYRPNETRNIENVRSGNHIAKQNPRLNDPGMSRTRESKGEIRNENQVKRDMPTDNSRIQPNREINNDDRNSNVTRDPRSNSPAGNKTENYEKPEKRSESTPEGIRRNETPGNEPRISEPKQNIGLERNRNQQETTHQSTVNQKIKKETKRAEKKKNVVSDSKNKERTQGNSPEHPNRSNRRK